MRISKIKISLTLIVDKPLTISAAFA